LEAQRAVSNSKEAASVCPWRPVGPICCFVTAFVCGGQMDGSISACYWPASSIKHQAATTHTHSATMHDSPPVTLTNIEPAAAHLSLWLARRIFVLSWPLCAGRTSKGPTYIVIRGPPSSSVALGPLFGQARGGVARGESRRKVGNSHGSFEFGAP